MDRRPRHRLQQTRRNCSCRLALRVAARRGQAEEETRPTVWGIFGANRTTMSFHNGTDNGQAHTHSRLLGGKEMIEDFFRAILRQAEPEIAHTDFRTLPVKRARSNNNAALGGRKRFHGVESVYDQV